MKEVKYGNSHIQIETRKGGYAHGRYEVTLLAGSWPNDEDLITLCDGGDPSREGHPGHFGGTVTPELIGNRKSVKVYED